MKISSPWSELRRTRTAALHRTLRNVVYDARTVGVVFIVAGILIAAFGFMQIRGYGRQLTLVASAVVLVTPGVMYWIAANALIHRRPHGALLARYAATAHVGAIVMLFMIYFARLIGPLSGYVLFPAIVATFFVPALIAFVAGTGKAMRIAAELQEPGHAFEPVMTPPAQRVIDIDAMDGSGRDSTIP